MIDKQSDLYKLGLSTRSLNCLRRGGIETVRELSRCTDEQLMSIKGLGTVNLAEVRGKFERFRQEEQWAEELEAEPEMPVIRNAEDYHAGAAQMRLAILKELDSMTAKAVGVRWEALRDVTRMIRRLEVP